MERFRYAAGAVGGDPLAPPVDLARELAAAGRTVFAGGSVAGALAQRRRAARERAVRAVLDAALEAERSALADDPSDDARLRESQLASLPDDPAAVIRELLAEPYPWRSEQARAAVDQLVAAAGAETAARRAATLAALLEAAARGEDVDPDAIRAAAGPLPGLGDRPSARDLADVLAERMAAGVQTPPSPGNGGSADPDAWDDLLRAAHPGLAPALQRLARAVQLHRPDAAGTPGGGHGSGPGLGAQGDSGTAAPGGGALPEDDVDGALRSSGLVTGSPRAPRLTPAAARRLGNDVLRSLAPETGPPGGHRSPRASGAGDPAGGEAPWHPGAPIDAAATVRAALLRDRAANAARMSVSETLPHGCAPGPAPLQILPADLRGTDAEGERAAAVCLLVDQSHSMVQSGLLAPAREAALALYALAGARGRRDAVAVIGFDREARVQSAADLLAPPRRVQGSNAAHAFQLAARHFARHPGLAPAVVAVTDGEPTAHPGPDGSGIFAWPPVPETAAATASALDALAARRARLILMSPAPPGPLADAFVSRGGTVHSGGLTPHGVLRAAFPGAL